MIQHAIKRFAESGILLFYNQGLGEVELMPLPRSGSGWNEGDFIYCKNTGADAASAKRERLEPDAAGPGAGAGVADAASAKRERLELRPC